MDTQNPPPACRRRSAETWAAAREAYLGGLSAAQVCERFDVGESALRGRARAEGWRRADQPDPDPDLDELDAPDSLEVDPALDSAALAELAAKRARRAVLRGRLRDAQGWIRVHQSYRALAADEANERERLARAAQTPEEPAAEVNANHARQSRLIALLKAADTIAGPDPEKETAGETDSEDEELHDLQDLHPDFEPSPGGRALNRAQRRIQARMAALKARQAARAGP